jgi:hypothetical protein
MTASNIPRIRLYIEEHGNTREELEEIGHRARDAKPVMRVIQALMVEAGMEQFATEGSRSGEKWKPDKEKWAARKTREGFSDDTEVKSSDLRTAMMAKTGGGGTIRRVSKASTTVGVRLYYAQFQGHKRRLLALTRDDKNRYASMMIDYILTGKVSDK